MVESSTSESTSDFDFIDMRKAESVKEMCVSSFNHSFMAMSPMTLTCVASSRLAQLDSFSHQISKINSFLFVSGLQAAHDMHLIRQNNITHVLDLSGLNHQSLYGSELEYMCLQIPDCVGQSIADHFFDCFDFIESGKRGGVLVHCQQGVSRSTSVVIAYLMMSEDVDYKTAFERVRRVRPIAEPNLGFALQLEKFFQQRHATPWDRAISADVARSISQNTGREYENLKHEGKATVFEVSDTNKRQDVINVEVGKSYVVLLRDHNLLVNCFGSKHQAALKLLQQMKKYEYAADECRSVEYSGEHKNEEIQVFMESQKVDERCDKLDALDSRCLDDIVEL